MKRKKENEIQFYTVQEISEMLSLCKGTIRKLIKQKQIRGRRIGCAIRVLDKDLQEFLSRARIVGQN